MRLYISNMSKEDIEQAIADLVEAVRIDAAIEAAKSDFELLSRQADDAYDAYKRALIRAEDAREKLLELQRHKRDVPALRERLSSLLEENDVSIDSVRVNTITITPEDRLRYVRDLEKSCLAPCGYKVQPEFMEDVVSGKHDGFIAEWMFRSGNVSSERQVSLADRLAYAMDVHKLLSICGDTDVARRSAHDVLDGKCDASVLAWLEGRDARVRSGV